MLFVCFYCYISHKRYIITITGVVYYGTILFGRLIEVEIGRDTKQWRTSHDINVILGRRKLGSKYCIYFII